MAVPLVGSEVFRLVMDLAFGGLVIATPTGEIMRANRDVERRFGYEQGELAGRTIDELVPELRELLPADAQATDGDGSSDARRRTARRKDGSLIAVAVGLRTVQTPDGTFVVVSVGNGFDEPKAPQPARVSEEEPFGFEHFVADLCGRFINAPAATLPAALESALEQICERFRLEGSMLYVAGAAGALSPAISWQASDGGQRGSASWTLPQSALARTSAGEIVALVSAADVVDDNERNAYRDSGLRSTLLLPLGTREKHNGVLAFVTVSEERTFSRDVVDRLTVLSALLAQVIERQQRDEALRRAEAEAESLKEQLRLEAIRSPRRDEDGPSRIVGQSLALRRVLEQIRQVAATDSTILLLGETGTGKELFAQEIHDLGPRRQRPMVKVNCAAIPATLIESELFGREKGAFTGALARQIGRFELAQHSTIFLDEIGDLPADVQIKLLRVLEEKQIERLGSPRSITVDTRVIAATHRNLEQRIAEGTFRQDLYYRLNVFPIHVPPLRERHEDIPLLVWRFVEEFSRSFGKRIDTIDPDNILALQQYRWPGNIRELRNVVERALISATGRRLVIPVPQAASAAVRQSPRLLDVEKEHIRGVLEGTGWRIRGVGGAADKLGLKPTTLETRIAKLGLKRPGRA